MAIRMMSGLPARIIQVLKDFLPAELDLIDAEEADGITTPDIPTANYYEWSREWVPEYPACAVRTVSSSPIEIRPITFGSRADADHRLDVIFHCTTGITEGDSDTMQALLSRYISGAMRVLCIQKEALQTSADATRFVELVEWSGNATYGPEVQQEDGAVVRSATLPITVRRREER